MSVFPLKYEKRNNCGILTMRKQTRVLPHQFIIIITKIKD